MPDTGRDWREVARDHDTRIDSAHDQVSENRHKLNNLEMTINIRLDQLKAEFQDLRNILKWAGGLIVSLMISFMGWALLQQFNANETAKADLQRQVELLEQAQENERRLRNQERVLIESGVAEPAATTNSSR